MSEQLATVEFEDDGIATLTLRRAGKRNAFSQDLLDACRARVAEVGVRGGVRALIVRGEGPAFCAGMDLKAVLGEPGAALRLLEGIGEFTISLAQLEAVVIAQVHGAAIGGGCGLVCACDMAVAAHGTKLGFPEVDLGLCPAVVAPWVHRTLGAARARRVLLMGGTMGATEALERGIVGELTDADSLEPRVRELAEHIAKASGPALAATKRLLNELDGGRTFQLVRLGAELSADVLSQDDAQERLRKIFESKA